MAKATVKVKVSSGKSSGNGTVLVRQHVVIVKNSAQTKPYGKPFYQTKAQMNIHIHSGNRPSSFRSRRAS